MSIISNRIFDRKHHKKIFSRKRLSFLKTLPLTKNSYFLHILFDKFHKFPRNKSSNFYWTHIKVLYIWHRMRKFMALYPFRNSLHLYERFAIYDVHKIISNLNMLCIVSSILISAFWCYMHCIHTDIKVQSTQNSMSAIVFHEIKEIKCCKSGLSLEAWEWGMRMINATMQNKRRKNLRKKVDIFFTLDLAKCITSTSNINFLL